MVTKTKKRKTPRRAAPLEQVRDVVTDAMEDVEKSARSFLRTLETQTTALETTARRQVARMLRECAKQLRRVERMVAPPPANKARTRVKKAAAPAQQAAKQAVKSVQTNLAA